MACRMIINDKQNNIPQFSTECAVQENENINPYMQNHWYMYVTVIKNLM